MKKRILFFAICLMQFAGNFANSLQGVLLSDYIAHYNLKSAGQGSLGSFQSAGCILACILILILAGRFKRYYLLICSGVFLSAAVLTIGTKPSLPVLLALYLLLGLGFASTSNLTSSLSTSLYPGSASAMGMAHAFFGAGGLTAPLILKRALLSVPWNRVALLDGAVVSAVLILYLVVLFSSGDVLQSIPESTQKVSFRGIGQFFARRRNILLLAATFGYQAFQNGVSVWMIRYSETELHETARGALLLSVFWIGTTVARLLATRLPVSPVRLFSYGCLISGAVFLPAVLTRSLPLMFAAMVIAGLSSGACVPLAYHLAASWNEGNSLLPTSICSFALFASMLVTSPITAAVSTNGVIFGMTAVAVYVLAGGAVLLPLTRGKR